MIGPSNKKSINIIHILSQILIALTPLKTIRGLLWLPAYILVKIPLVYQDLTVHTLPIIFLL